MPEDEETRKTADSKTKKGSRKTDGKQRKPGFPDFGGGGCEETICVES